MKSVEYSMEESGKLLGGTLNSYESSPLKDPFGPNQPALLPHGFWKSADFFPGVRLQATK